jgi:hypothetical protein
MNKENLIAHYVNLYRLLYKSNSGLWTDDLNKMTEKELKKEIQEMQEHIKNKNSFFPAFN